MCVFVVGCGTRVYRVIDGNNIKIEKFERYITTATKMNETTNERKKKQEKPMDER